MKLFIYYRFKHVIMIEPLMKRSNINYMLIDYLKINIHKLKLNIILNEKIN